MKSILHTLINKNPNLSSNTLQSYYSTKRVYSLPTKPSQKYACDNTGKHPHQVNTICDKPICETSTCSTPCGEIKEGAVTGNYTHVPPNKPNVNVVLLSKTDINGKPIPQYFVKEIPAKIIPKNDLENFTENDLVHNEKGTKFCTSTPQIEQEIT